MAADAVAREAISRSVGSLRRWPPRALAARSSWKAAKLSVSDELWFDRPRAPAGGTGFGEIAYRRQRRELRAAVRRLGGRSRAVFVLECLAGWPAQVVRDELGLDAEAYATRSAHARRIVLEQLREGEPSDLLHDLELADEAAVQPGIAQQLQSGADAAPIRSAGRKG